jgi:hypothetical protein
MTKQLFSICCTIPFPFFVYLYTLTPSLVVGANVSCATAIDQGLPAEGLQKRKGNVRRAGGNEEGGTIFFERRKGRGGNVSPVLFVLGVLHEPEAALQQPSEETSFIHPSQAQSS